MAKLSWLFFTLYINTKLHKIIYIILVFFIFNKTEKLSKI